MAGHVLLIANLVKCPYTRVCCFNHVLNVSDHNKIDSITTRWWPVNSDHFQGILKKGASTGELDRRTGSGSIRSNASSVSYISTDSAGSVMTNASMPSDSNASFVIDVRCKLYYNFSGCLCFVVLNICFIHFKGRFVHAFYF